MAEQSLIGQLIEALQIFEKYMEPGQYPTHCQHDIMYVCVDYDAVSDEDKARLDELGFFEQEEGFASYRFGSA